MFVPRSLIGAACIFVASVLHAQSGADVDYSLTANWLCAPSSVACTGAKKDVSVDLFSVDCFYLADDSSTDPSLAIKQYIAQFGQVDCRLFAPTLYGDPNRAARAAWASYLEHSNDGRGVIIVGLARGAATAQSLLATDIDGKPSQARIITAVLLDQKPSQRKSFRNMTPCYADNQIECVLTDDELDSTWQLTRQSSMRGKGVADLVNRQSRAYLAVAAECACKKEERISRKASEK